jgi:3-dehydroquinate dehydratase-1
MGLDLDRFVLAAVTDRLGTGIGEAASNAGADAVEFRMDLCGDDPIAAIDAYDGALPLIATNRAVREGGEAGGPERDRIGTLAAAVARDPVAAVDVELDALESGGPAVETVRDTADRRGATVIASAHDFERTPPAADCRALLDRGATAGDVAKLATTANDPGDVLALLRATHAASADGHRVATMAMGAAGRHSRAVAPIYGSRIGYAPVDPADATAPGQYDLGTLRSLIGRLRDPGD